ncbi:hypothetical protein SORBI_3009G027700 [Sorghum bicolor]|uniref:DUF1618 domain-containing protein n=2 Tax=Sorghum bicolor TaxID=4558 RepID=A0A1Z5R0K7_SORBI|nr:hypothetical protein SORBI_3009G027700 [Sorghum bicolor]
MSTGKSIQVSLCLGRPPLLSYLCAHSPGPVFGSTVGTVFGPPAGTPAVRCVSVPPVVLSTHADLALLRVTIPGAPLNDSSFDYFVYTARPRPGGASSLDLLPRPTGASRFRDFDVAILRCSGGGGSRYVIAALRTTNHRLHFSLQRYDSDTRSWTMTPLSLDHQPERDKVLPIPNSATEVVFHNTNKLIVLGSTTVVGWVDLWRGILFCDVLDENPVLRDMPLPKPARSNRRSFCIGSAMGQRDIAVLTIAEEVKIRYVDLEIRPGVVPSPQRRQPMDDDDHSGSSSDDGEHDFDVAYYWKTTVWSMPVPITSWKDWHKDCTVDVADTIVENPRHCEVLLALPTRLSTDPVDAAVSLRRMYTGFPTLGLGMDGNLAIFFLSKVDRLSTEGWVIEVGVKDNKLQGIARLDDRKYTSFRRYYCITDISKYLIRATGAAGALVRTRMRNK